MPAGKYSFIIEQGTTTQFEIQYKDVNSTPVDLTGYGAKMQIRPSIDSTEAYLTLSSSLQADGTGLNMSGSDGNKPPTSGSIGIIISSTTSSLLNFSQAVYDLEIYSSENPPRVVRVLEGQVKLSKEVTR